MDHSAYCLNSRKPYTIPLESYSAHILFAGDEGSCVKNLGKFSSQSAAESEAYNRFGLGDEDCEVITISVYRD